MKEKYIYAGQTIPTRDGREFEAEDWGENVLGRSWMMATGNPTAIIYAIRRAYAGLPMDDNVVYGHIDGMGILLHVSELDVPKEE